MLKNIANIGLRLLPFKIPIFGMIRDLVSVPPYIYRHLHFSGEITVSVNPQASFKMNAFNVSVENELFWSGYGGEGWEGESQQLWAQLCSNSNVIFDIGANTGPYALAAAAVNHGATVIAFEPVKRICVKLRENIRLNRTSVLVEELAVSDQVGQAVFYDTTDDHLYSASLEKNMLGDRSVVQYDVQIISLDAYCAEYNIQKVDLLKIDVEKHEVAVISGALKTIQNSRPVIIIEILGVRQGRLIKSMISELNYKIYSITENGPQRGIRPVDIPDGSVMNYLLCPAEKCNIDTVASRNRFTALSGQAQ